MEQKRQERLFACFCKINSTGLAQAAESTKNEHLLYAYGLGKRGIAWAAGPTGNYQSTLSIYAVNSKEVAKKAKRNDPFYIKGLFYDDAYYQWFIHAPLSLSSPEHSDMLENSLKRAGITPPVGSESGRKIPDRLFFCFSRMKPLLKGSGELVREHFLYQFGYLCKEGLIWAGGPLDDYDACLQIFSVNSIEEAKRAVQEDPFYINGIFYDNEFYEWFIHSPLDKASPAHKHGLEQSLIKMGIALDKSV